MLRKASSRGVPFSSSAQSPDVHSSFEDPLLPNRGYFLWLPFLYLVFRFAYLDSSRFFFSLSFLFRLAPSYMAVPLTGLGTVIRSESMQLRLPPVILLCLSLEFGSRYLESGLGVVQSYVTIKKQYRFSFHLFICVLKALRRWRRGDTCRLDQLATRSH